MKRLLLASHSCTSLGCFSGASAFCPILSRGPLKADQPPRKHSSSERDPRQEYQRFKEDMLRKFYDRQSRLQDTFNKLGVQRDVHKSTADLESADRHQAPEATFDVCSSSSTYAESDVKINCIRATPSLQDKSLSVAADRMARGGIAKLEKRVREQQKMAKQFGADSVLTECIPLYKE